MNNIKASSAEQVIKIDIIL